MEEKEKLEMNGEKWYMYKQKEIHLFYIVLLSEFLLKKYLWGKPRLKGKTSCILINFVLLNRF